MIPSNDFSLYDHVLDTSAMVGNIPAAYGWNGGPVSLPTYFAIARGSQGSHTDEGCGHIQAPGHAPGHTHDGEGAPAAEMTSLPGAASRRLPADQLWVNPDCGLKTRKWPEVRLAIENMAAAAHAAREAA